MTPDKTSLKLSGIRIDKFPSSKIASVMSKESESLPVEPAVAIPVVGEAVVEPAVAIPVVGEAVVEPAVAMPVVGEAVVDVAETVEVVDGVVPAPAVQSAPAEEEEEMDFDMEWD
jgi:hypothetical protein